MAAALMLPSKREHATLPACESRLRDGESAPGHWLLETTSSSPCSGRGMNHETPSHRIHVIMGIFQLGKPAGERSGIEAKWEGQGSCRSGRPNSERARRDERRPTDDRTVPPIRSVSAKPSHTTLHANWLVLRRGLHLVPAQRLAKVRSVGWPLLVRRAPPSIVPPLFVIILLPKPRSETIREECG